MLQASKKIAVTTTAPRVSISKVYQHHRFRARMRILGMRTLEGNYSKMMFAVS
jgi:hypothetical protein